MAVVIRATILVLAFSLTVTCTYVPTLPGRNDGPQQINPPVPKLP